MAAIDISTVLLVHLLQDGNDFRRLMAVSLTQCAYSEIHFTSCVDAPSSRCLTAPATPSRESVMSLDAFGEGTLFLFSKFLYPGLVVSMSLDPAFWKRKSQCFVPDESSE